MVEFKVGDVVTKNRMRDVAIRTACMRHIARVAAVIILAAPTVLTAQQAVSAFPSDADVLAILKQRIDDRRSAGIVIGLLEPDGRTRIVAYGDAGPGQPPLDGNSVFEIGSITKVFTSTALALLVQEHTFSLDDAVQKFLPATVHLPTRNGKQITLGRLSEQNSGLPRMPANFHPADSANPFADYAARNCTSSCQAISSRAIPVSASSTPILALACSAMSCRWPPQHRSSSSCVRASGSRSP